MTKTTAQQNLSDTLKSITLAHGKTLAEKKPMTADCLLVGTALKCIHCGNPASCVGKYDNMDGYEPACDDCCGHGNEDGHCEQVTADPA